MEDDDDLRANLADLLQDCGFEVAVAGDAVQALDVLRAGEVDLVLTDYRMPGLTGLQLVAEVKRTHPGVRCILMTAFGDGFTEIEAVRKGATGYVAKPFEATEIVGLVENVLRLGRE